MAEEIITLGDITEYIELPPFEIEQWVYSVISIDELYKLDGDEELQISRYSNDNTQFYIKYNSISGSHPIGYENIVNKTEYSHEEFFDILTGSNWHIDNSDWEALTQITGSENPEDENQYWINPAYVGQDSDYFVALETTSSLE